MGNAKVLANVDGWINFFDGLVSHLDKKIGSHLETQTGTAPW